MSATAFKIVVTGENSATTIERTGLIDAGHLILLKSLGKDDEFTYEDMVLTVDFVDIELKNHPGSGFSVEATLYAIAATQD